MGRRTFTVLAAVVALVAGCSAESPGGEHDDGGTPAPASVSPSAAGPDDSAPGPSSESGASTAASPDAESTPGAPGSPTPTTDPPAAFPLPFPTASLAEVSDTPLTGDLTGALQAVLDDVAASSGTVATAAVLRADGTWSGAAGTTVDGAAATPDLQLELGAITKTVVATQVMSLAEAGTVDLDRAAADYLPDLPIDPGPATVRDLLGLRSSILDYTGPVGVDVATRGPEERWETTEILARLPEPPEPIRSATHSPTDYLLLGLLVEEVTGLPLAEALRAGVLADPGLGRLVVQPGERPTGPVALSVRRSAPVAMFEAGERYLPSLRDASYAGAAEGMAGDAPTTARFMQLLCGGHLVSRTSLTEMAATDGLVPWGLGLIDVTASVGVPAVGGIGRSWYYDGTALCLPEQGAVLVLLTNDPHAPALEDAVPRMVAALRDS